MDEEDDEGSVQRVIIIAFGAAANLPLINNLLTH